MSERWTERLISVAMVLAWLCGAAGLWAMNRVETSALYQPNEQSEFYSNALHIKGVVRYITDDQRVAETAGEVAFGTGGLAFAALLLWKRRRERRTR